MGQLAKVLHYAATDSISDLFERYAQYFKVFEAYTNNQDNARERVNACKKIEVRACACPQASTVTRAEGSGPFCAGVQARVQAVPGGPALWGHGSAQLAHEYASRARHRSRRGWVG